MVKLIKYRKYIQGLGALAFNGNLKGFVEGRIYDGVGKSLCVPVLNCYSCPGALGACPIGSMQAVLGSPMKNFSFYVLGLLLLFGITLGRLFCGFLCPFGFFQDIIDKIPLKKVKLNKKFHKILSYGKYVMLFLFVIILPLVMKNSLGVSSPYFCKYVCPAGTLGAGLPLTLLQPTLRQGLGYLFMWKLSLAIAIVFLSIKIHRFFCKYLCPLGAFYGICNSHSFFSMKVDNEKCIKCRKCVRSCKMGVEPYLNPNSADCIRCGDCVKDCPTSALNMNFKNK